MERHIFDIAVETANQGEAGAGARALADKLREAEGVLETQRLKADSTTMDLGTIVQIVATSGATMAIAHGIAAWLRGRRGVTLRIERDGKSGSIKVAVNGIDPEAAVRIVEHVREG
jgi:hypothetical protein